MITCTITSPEQTAIYKNVRSIALPGFFGRMQILPGHSEAFVLLKKGAILLRQSNKQSKNIQIMDGECYIKKDAVTVILHYV